MRKRQKPIASERPSVLVIGELNPDLIAVGLSGPPRVGHEILAADFQQVLGSASAIFACGVAKLGHPVRFVSKVGDDELGRFCLESLAHNGVPTDHITLDHLCRTGVTIALSTGADRALVTYPGAVADFKIRDIDRKLFRGQTHLHMTSYFLQTGLKPDFPEIMSWAKDAGLSVSFDPNADPSSRWRHEIWQVFEQTDILFLNETEAREFTGKDDPDRALVELSAAAPCVVIKLGARGALGGNRRERVFVPGFPVDAVDPTGAGDSFDAGFVHAYLSGKVLRDCLVVANASGALSTLKPGGTAGQASREMLTSFLRTRPAPRQAAPCGPR